LAYRKNVQVPVCPLCNAPVPGKADELPDIRVSRHIDSDCQSDRAVTHRKKVYTNKCSFKGCKGKELIPITCDRCMKNYCLRHRHIQDHGCSQMNSKPVGKAAMAALSRKTPNVNSQSSIPNKNHNVHTSVPAGRSANCAQSSLQGNLSEEAALQMALQASMSEVSVEGSQVPNSNGLTAQEQEDFMLAQAIAESERTSRPVANQRRSQNSCYIT